MIGSWPVPGHTVQSTAMRRCIVQRLLFPDRHQFEHFERLDGGVAAFRLNGDGFEGCCLAWCGEIALSIVDHGLEHRAVHQRAEFEPAVAQADGHFV